VGDTAKTDDDGRLAVDVIVDRCAALDVHKKTVMVAVRTPGPDGGRRQQVKEHSTYTGGLVALRDWLVAEGVTQVVMEATGVYWRPVWHVLEEVSNFELLLVNPRHVKNLPGRKTDVKDAEWLVQLLECGLLRGSFVPPREIARLRDLTRYRTKLVRERAREVQRLQKLLEDAGVKLESVVSDVTGKAARQMIEALIAGERDPDVLADMALTRMRPKIGELRKALVGRFDSHHALLARMHLDHMDELAGMVERLDQEVDRLMAPFDEAATRLLTIPGVGKRTAEVVIAEIGVDMSRFPTAAHLASWAGLCPGNDESAGKVRSGRARKGDEALRTALCEAAWAASHGKDTYLAVQYRRFLRRFGNKSEGKAIFAVAHTLVVIIWHVLANGCTYQELGADYFNRRNDSESRQRYLIRELEKFGNRVTLTPAA
jgi:transposase